MFETFKMLQKRTNGLLNYNDIQKKKLKYKTSKSFFKILKISKKNNLKYFSNRIKV